MSIQEIYRLLLTLFVILSAIYMYPKANKREKIASIIVVFVLILVTILNYI